MELELIFKQKKVTISKLTNQKPAAKDKDNRRNKTGWLLQNGDSGKASLRNVMFGWDGKAKKG